MSCEVIDLQLNTVCVSIVHYVHQEMILSSQLKEHVAYGGDSVARQIILENMSRHAGTCGTCKRLPYRYVSCVTRPSGNRRALGQR